MAVAEELVLDVVSLTVLRTVAAWVSCLLLYPVERENGL